MIFREPYQAKPEEVIACGKYHPYRVYGERNPNFDAYSGFILDLKEGQTGAVERFRTHLEKYLALDIAVAVVPSHDPAKTTSGIRALAVKVAANDRIDATSCLARTKKIDKLAAGGSRDMKIHLESIEVRDAHLFQGEEIALLDDVTTSGHSLLACRQLLLEAGASVVQCLAMARTVHE